jgi:hypothetical protein
VNADQARKQASRAVPRVAQVLVDRVRTAVKRRSRDGYREASLPLGSAGRGAVSAALAALRADGFVANYDEQFDRLEVTW